LVFDVHIRDVNFAFKLCQRSIFDKLELASEGSFIDAELLIRAQGLGFRIIQFGVDYFPRSVGVSTLSSGDVIKNILREMAAQAWASASQWWGRIRPCWARTRSRRGSTAGAGWRSLGGCSWAGRRPAGSARTIFGAGAAPRSRRWCGWACPCATWTATSTCT